MCVVDIYCATNHCCSAHTFSNTVFVIHPLHVHIWRGLPATHLSRSSDQQLTNDLGVAVPFIYGKVGLLCIKTACFHRKDYTAVLTPCLPILDCFSSHTVPPTPATIWLLTFCQHRKQKNIRAGVEISNRIFAWCAQGPGVNMVFLCSLANVEFMQSLPYLIAFPTN